MFPFGSTTGGMSRRGKARATAIAGKRARTTAASQAADVAMASPRTAVRSVRKTPSTTVQRDARRLGMLADRRSQAQRQTGTVTRLDVGATPSQIRTVAAAAKGCVSRTIVLVHSPFCGFCQRLRPEWDVAARLIAEQGVNVLEVDSRALGAATGVPLARELTEGMAGVPHILLLGPRASGRRMYNGDRSVSSLLGFATG